MTYVGHQRFGVTFTYAVDGEDIRCTDALVHDDYRARGHFLDFSRDNLLIQGAILARDENDRREILESARVMEKRGA